MNNETFKHTTKEGLKCIYIRRPGFLSQYAGIGVHYGSAHRIYSHDGVRKESKTGIAHFLEHKAFIMPDGRDALEIFDSLNCEANAYTGREQTIYFFQTSDSLMPPLSLLLEMFFTPGFTEENIESEKDIILSELEETLDRVDSRIYDECMESLYPGDPYSEEILGKREDILSMNYQDLKEVYDAFYTPENALLVVVADKDEKEIFDYVDEVMGSLKVNHSTATSIPFIKSSAMLPPRVIYEDVPYPEIHILGRIPGYTYDTPILTNEFIALMDGVFSVEAEFYKSLEREGLLLNDDIEYSFATHEYGMYYHFEAYTDEPELLLKKMTEKIQGFCEEDFNEGIAKNELRANLCDYIRALDSISYVGDETLSLGLEGTDYLEEYECLKKLQAKDIEKFIPDMKNSEFTSIIVLPKNCTEEAQKP